MLDGSSCSYTLGLRARKHSSKLHIYLYKFPSFVIIIHYRACVPASFPSVSMLRDNKRANTYRLVHHRFIRENENTLMRLFQIQEHE